MKIIILAVSLLSCGLFWENDQVFLAFGIITARLSAWLIIVIQMLFKEWHKMKYESQDSG